MNKKRRNVYKKKRRTQERLVKLQLRLNVLNAKAFLSSEERREIDKIKEDQKFWSGICRAQTLRLVELNKTAKKSRKAVDAAESGFATDESTELPVEKPSIGEPQTREEPAQSKGDLESFSDDDFLELNTNETLAVQVTGSDRAVAVADQPTEKITLKPLEPEDEVVSVVIKQEVVEEAPAKKDIETVTIKEEKDADSTHVSTTAKSVNSDTTSKAKKVKKTAKPASWKVKKQLEDIEVREAKLIAAKADLDKVAEALRVRENLLDTYKASMDGIEAVLHNRELFLKTKQAEIDALLTRGHEKLVEKESYLAQESQVVHQLEGIKLEVGFDSLLD